jgi:hypothetical protein
MIGRGEPPAFPSLPALRPLNGLAVAEVSRKKAARLFRIHDLLTKLADR